MSELKWMSNKDVMVNTDEPKVTPLKIIIRCMITVHIGKSNLGCFHNLEIWIG